MKNLVKEKKKIFLQQLVVPILFVFMHHQVLRAGNSNVCICCAYFCFKAVDCSLKPCMCSFKKILQLSSRILRMWWQFLMQIIILFCLQKVDLFDYGSRGTVSVFHLQRNSLYSKKRIFLCLVSYLYGQNLFQHFKQFLRIRVNEQLF